MPTSPRCSCRASAASRTSETPTHLAFASVRVATQCTEADTADQHIATARDGRVWLPHDEPPCEPKQLAAQAKLMESYGAHCVYVTDSGGRLTMDGIRDRFRAYRDVLDPPPNSASTPTRTCH